MREFRSDLIPRPRLHAEFVFPQHPHVDLEIGCGVGWHPVTYSLQNPDRCLIAIEHTAEKFAKFQRRFETHGQPSNLVPIHANAISFVTHFVPAASLDQVFLLYPNPTDYWYKMPFFGHLLSKLKPGGTLTLATNLADYVADAREFFRATWNLKLISETHPTIPRTHFEKKYLRAGQVCFNQVWQVD